MKKLIVIAIIGAIGYFSYASLYGDKVEHGRYVNKRYGFSINIPEGWQVVDESAIKKACFSTAGPQDNRVFAINQQAEEGIFTVSIMTRGVGYSAMLQDDARDNLVSQYKSAGFRIKKNKIEDINGQSVFHLSAVFNKRYYDFYFTGNDDAIILVSIELPTPINYSEHRRITRAAKSMEMEI